MPIPGEEHVLLGSREEETFSGDGLELMAELTDNQKKYWRALLEFGWFKGSSLQSATALGWHKMQFQHLWFAGAVKKNKYHKAQNTDSTGNCAGHAGVVIGKQPPTRAAEVCIAQGESPSLPQ